MRYASNAPPMRAESVPAVPAKGSPIQGCSGWVGPALASPRCVDHAPDAYRLADVLSGSNHAREVAHSRQRVGAARGSPGAACAWRFPAIGTADVSDTGDNR